MELKMLGIDFPHRKDEFSHKAICPYYTVCCFATPFVYLSNGIMHKGEAGDILINTPDHIVYHGPLPGAEQGFVNDWFHIEGEDFGKLLKKYPLPLNEKFSVGQSYFFRKYASQLLLEFNSEKAGAEEKIDCFITQMIIDTYRAYTTNNSYNEPYEEIAAVRRAIIKNPEKDWTLNKMSFMSGYSVSRFSELYCKLYSISPINDVLNQRILLAKRLLASGQASVSYVAETCGFKTVSYFSKFYKRATGHTPSEFINSIYE